MEESDVESKNITYKEMSDKITKQLKKDNYEFLLMTVSRS